MKKALFFTLFLLFLMPLSSAKIILPEFKESYSIGDSIDSSFRIIEDKEVSGLIRLELSCAEKTVFFTSPVSLKANEEKKITVNPYTLEKPGNCAIEATLNGNIMDNEESKGFLISDEIIISIKLNKESFNPGDVLKIAGEAKKANGQYADGIASIKLGKEGYSEIVKKGNFEFETSLKENFLSGDSEIFIEIKDSIGNSGNLSKKITVAAISTTLEISVNNDSFIPGEILKASANLYDQSGNEIDNAVISLILYDSWGLEIIKKIVNSSNEEIEYEFNKKTPTGEWWLYAYSEGIKIRKFISVEEVSKIDADIKENKLTILNIGNIMFKKPLSILFQRGDETKEEIQELGLGIESVKEYKLAAPDGVYNITIKSGDFEKNFNDVYLTGDAVKISEFGADNLSLLKSIVAAAIILAIITAAVILKIKRTRNKPINITRRIMIKNS